jgi:regulator of sirC expression with transglutaminase-like and TPR domain
MTVAERFERMARSTDDDIDVVLGALLIAAEEYPQLDIESYQQRINELGRTLKRRLRPDISTTDSILALNRYLFEERGFHGATEDYYDPRNSFLNDVLDRRVGIPITLALIYIATGRAIGLALQGVSFPGHFLVRCPVRDGTVILDPYHKGISLGIADLQKRLAPVKEAPPKPAEVAALLTPASAREVLTRLLRNLRGIYTHYQQLPQALSATSRILALTPGNAVEWRERAGLHLKLECFRAALTDFQSYLALAPDADDAEATRSRIVELQQVCARMN